VYLPHSPRFWAFRDHCPPSATLNVSAHRMFGRPVLLLPILTSHIDAACTQPRWSILATWRSHLHFRLSYCYDVLHIAYLPYCRIRHSAAPYNKQYSLLHLGTASFKSSDELTNRYSDVSRGLIQLPPENQTTSEKEIRYSHDRS
jgi:hypothetical protein